MELVTSHPNKIRSQSRLECSCLEGVFQPLRWISVSDPNAKQLSWTNDEVSDTRKALAQTLITVDGEAHEDLCVARWALKIILE